MSDELLGGVAAGGDQCLGDLPVNMAVSMVMKMAWRPGMREQVVGGLARGALPAKCTRERASTFSPEASTPARFERRITCRNAR